MYDENHCLLEEIVEILGPTIRCSLILTACLKLSKLIFEPKKLWRFFTGWILTVPASTMLKSSKTCKLYAILLSFISCFKEWFKFIMLSKLTNKHRSVFYLFFILFSFDFLTKGFKIGWNSNTQQFYIQITVDHKMELRSQHQIFFMFERQPNCENTQASSSNMSVYFETVVDVHSYLEGNVSRPFV